MQLEGGGWPRHHGGWEARSHRVGSWSSAQPDARSTTPRMPLLSALPGTPHSREAYVGLVTVALDALLAPETRHGAAHAGAVGGQPKVVAALQALAAVLGARLAPAHRVLALLIGRALGVRACSREGGGMGRGHAGWRLVAAVPGGGSGHPAATGPPSLQRRGPLYPLE